MAVQRQAAASRSARPWMRLQQGLFGGVPTTRCTKSFNKLAHTPNLRVSLGQVAGGWWCLWPFEGGGQGTYVELTTAKKRRLRESSRRALEAIALKTVHQILNLMGCECEWWRNDEVSQGFYRGRTWFYYCLLFVEITMTPMAPCEHTGMLYPATSTTWQCNVKDKPLEYGVFCIC